jgi:hypothetical protein
MLDPASLVKPRFLECERFENVRSIRHAGVVDSVACNRCTVPSKLVRHPKPTSTSCRRTCRRHQHPARQQPRPVCSVSSRVPNPGVSARRVAGSFGSPLSRDDCRGRRGAPEFSRHERSSSGRLEGVVGSNSRCAALQMLRHEHPVALETRRDLALGVGIDVMEPSGAVDGMSSLHERGAVQPNL